MVAATAGGAAPARLARLATACAATSSRPWRAGTPCSMNTRRWAPGCRAATRRGRRRDAGRSRRRAQLRPGQRRGARHAHRIARRPGGALRRHLGRGTRRGAMAAAAAARCLHSAAAAGGRGHSLGQRRRADATRHAPSLAAWRAGTDAAGVLLGAARGRRASHPSPLLARLERADYAANAVRSPAGRSAARSRLERSMTSQGVAVDTSAPGARRRRPADPAGGVRLPCLWRVASRRARNSKARARPGSRASAACCCTRRSSWCGSSSMDIST